ncbi:UDP-2,4-diacetamido-2,4,6-trideoxy-beta-L-altropyranose hydrolase [Rhodopirellula baltica]
MKLLIRADASSEIGTGHVMRMIALAQAWQDRGGTPVIATARCPLSLKQRLSSERIGHVELVDTKMGSHVDATETSKLANALGTDWIVLDGYHFDINYQRTIRNATGRKLLVVDDCEPNQLWCADAILNQNIYAQELDYESESPGCVNLLGLKYVLLRREFSQSAIATGSERHQVQRVLVTLGGGDPDNTTAKVLALLETSTNRRLEIRAIVGAANPFLESLRTTTKRSRHKINFLKNVTDMNSQFAWADAVVSAAGSTCWEWLLFGLRGAVVSIAENQQMVATALAQQNIAVDLGSSDELQATTTSPKLKTFVDEPISDPKHCERQVDGFGACRVAAFLNGGLWLRPASRDDCKQYFDWANDSEVRTNSLNPEKIPWEAHLAWFTSKIDSAESNLFVAMLEDSAIGQIRFDKDDANTWEIDFSVSRNFRGKGIGIDLLRLGVARQRRQNDQVIKARVKTTNQRSMNCFERLGFKRSNYHPNDLATYVMDGTCDISS